MLILDLHFFPGRMRSQELKSCAYTSQVLRGTQNPCRSPSWRQGWVRQRLPWLAARGCPSHPYPVVHSILWAAPWLPSVTQDFPTPRGTQNTISRFSPLPDWEIVQIFLCSSFKEGLLKQYFFFSSVVKSSGKQSRSEVMSLDKWLCSQ